MTQFEWKCQYAPHGYSWVRHRLDFYQMEHTGTDRTGDRPRWLVSYHIDQLHSRLREANPLYDPRDTFTIISIYPREPGIHINRIDPLRPPLGIDIELRWPLKARKQKDQHK